MQCDDIVNRVYQVFISILVLLQTQEFVRNTASALGALLPPQRTGYSERSELSMRCFKTEITDFKAKQRAGTITHNFDEL